jgi:hypothetical protein
MIKAKNQLTWLKMMPVCIDVLESDKYNAGAKKNVQKELMRLAKLVDGVNSNGNKYSDAPNKCTDCGKVIIGDDKKEFCGKCSVK